MLEIKYRKLVDLEPLHNNPRYMKEGDAATLCESLRNNPEYFEARPLILSNRTGIDVIIAGNMRYACAVDIGLKEVPTILIPGLTEEKEREIIIRDNVNNGSWDYDALANSYDKDELIEWGVPALWDLDEEDNEDGSVAPLPSSIKMTIQFETQLQLDQARLEIEELLLSKYPGCEVK